MFTVYTPDFAELVSLKSRAGLLTLDSDLSIFIGYLGYLVCMYITWLLLAMRQSSGGPPSFNPSSMLAKAAAYSQLMNCQGWLFTLPMCVYSPSTFPRDPTAVGEMPYLASAWGAPKSLQETLLSGIMPRDAPVVHVSFPLAVVATLGPICETEFKVSTALPWLHPSPRTAH